MSIYVANYISASGSTPYTTGVETPVGTVNGTNRTFTVTNTPKYIVSDGVTYFENSGYTLSTLTITMDFAPVGFITSAY